jgi:hypothetical protein
MTAPFFSLSPRERVGVREDQIVSLLGSPLTLALSLGEREPSLDSMAPFIVPAPTFSRKVTYKHL